MFILFTICLIKVNFSKAYPKDWELIKLGMNISQVHSNLPRINRAMKDLKDFESEGIDLGNSYWVLRVYYDAQDNVKRIEKEYIYRPLGIFNRKIITE